MVAVAIATVLDQVWGNGEERDKASVPSFSHRGSEASWLQSHSLWFWIKFEEMVKKETGLDLRKHQREEAWRGYEGR
ncbi:hypothetical protein VNO80_12979 [Phaseolus coccineus]|uniref:Uncharacterized protein n=1 Tax=Phaseolus coccineus TaxID=3886 RepID=A0AAN9N115_PHACN